MEHVSARTTQTSLQLSPKKANYHIQYQDGEDAKRLRYCMIRRASSDKLLHTV